MDHLACNLVLLVLGRHLIRGCKAILEREREIRKRQGCDIEESDQCRGVSFYWLLVYLRCQGGDRATQKMLIVRKSHE